MDGIDQLTRAEQYLTDLTKEIAQAKVGIARVIKRQRDIQDKIRKIKSELDRPPSDHGQFTNPEIAKVIAETYEELREQRQDELAMLAVERDELHGFATTLIHLLQRGECLLDGVVHGNLREMMAYQSVVLEIRIRDLETAKDAALNYPALKDTVRKRIADVQRRAEELLVALENADVGSDA